MSRDLHLKAFETSVWYLWIIDGMRFADLKRNQ